MRINPGPNSPEAGPKAPALRAGKPAAKRPGEEKQQFIILPRVLRGFRGLRPRRKGQLLLPEDSRRGTPGPGFGPGCVDLCAGRIMINVSLKIRPKTGKGKPQRQVEIAARRVLSEKAEAEVKVKQEHEVLPFLFRLCLNFCLSGSVSSVVPLPFPSSRRMQ